MLGFPAMGDADFGGNRHLGGFVGAHNDVIAHVLRRRPQRSHARALGTYQCQMHVPDAVACVSGK